jgi:hypothetical protein
MTLHAQIYGCKTNHIVHCTDKVFVIHSLHISLHVHYIKHCVTCTLQIVIKSTVYINVRFFVHMLVFEKMINL